MARIDNGGMKVPDWVLRGVIAVLLVYLLWGLATAAAEDHRQIWADHSTVEQHSGEIKDLKDQAKIQAQVATDVAVTRQDVANIKEQKKRCCKLFKVKEDSTMTADPSNTTNHADESARADNGGVVQITRFESPSVDKLANILLLVILAFIATVPLSIYAVVKVDLASQANRDAIASFKTSTDAQFKDLRTDARLAAYWGERAEVAMTARGIAVPPYPTRKVK